MSNVNYYENTRVTKASHGLSASNVGYCKSIRIYNGSGHPVYVVDRSGLPIYLPSKKGNYRGIIIETILAVSGDSVIDPLNQYPRDTESKIHERRILSEELDRIHVESNEYGFHVNNTTISLDYSISSEEFEEMNYSIYIAELDIVISSPEDSGKFEVVHPYSKIETRKHLIKSEVADKPEGFYQSIWIVSNDRSVTSKYINRYGKVYYVPSIIDYSLQNGFYICGNSSVQSGGDAIVERTRCDIEEAIHKYGLYDTVEEALTLGNQNSLSDEVDMSRKLELENMKHEVLLMEKELKLLKSNKDASTLEMQETIEKLKHERDKHAHEASLEKAAYERELELAKRATNNDANLHNKEQLAWQMELEKIKQQQIEMENRYKEAKLRQDYELSEYKNRMKYEEDERARRLALEKELLERRSMERKEQSEIVKYMPTIMGGLIAIGAILIKNK